MSEDPKKKKAVAKKVKPYPFEGEMLHGANKVTLAILRVSVSGLVAQVRTGICHVGVHYQCAFTLPGSHIPTHVEGQVFKTYDGVDPKTRAIERVVEVVFIKASEGERNKIRSFLNSIGQRE